MFWGISLESGKRYSQTVEQSFHISMAALNAKNSGQGSVTIMVEVEKACYPLCTLNPDKIPQQALDYIFTEGEEVLFYTEGGNMEVHLTGYLIDDPNPVEYSTEEEGESASSNASSSEAENDAENDAENEKNTSKEESSEEENLQTLISELDGLNEDNEGAVVDLWLPRSARKKHKKNDETDYAQVSLTDKLLEDGGDDESEDEDWQPGSKRKMVKKKSSADVEDVKKVKQIDNVSKHDTKKHGESNDSSTKDVSPMKAKKKTPKDKPTTSSVNGLHDSVEDHSPSKKVVPDEKSPVKDNKMDVQSPDDKQHEKKHLSGGTVIEDLEKGTGKKAKRGRKVSLYYKGSLKKSKKVFDECFSGEPFTFRLGDGEVIRGWETGIEGMHVGGKRRLVIPPSQGYGSKPMGSIPPNSTLIFVVELVKVH